MDIVDRLASLALRAAEMVSAIERSFERHGAFLAARRGDAA